MRIAALLATRRSSKRVKNKSTKKFGKFNLTTLKLSQIERITEFTNSYFSSDINSLNVFAKRKSIILIKRDDKYLGEATISDFAPFLAKKIKEDHICYLNNTSPLLKISTILKALKLYKNLNFRKYDSLGTFELCNEFLWNKDGPINYDLKKTPMTQNLKGVYKLIPALSIIPKKILFKTKNVIGSKPYKLLISKPESIKISNLEDYELAKLFRKKYSNLI